MKKVKVIQEAPEPKNLIEKLLQPLLITLPEPTIYTTQERGTLALKVKSI